MENNMSPVILNVIAVCYIDTRYVPLLMSLLCSSCHPAINQFSTAHHSDSLREDFYKAFYFKPNTYTYFYKLLAQRYAYSLYKSTKSSTKELTFFFKTSALWNNYALLYKYFIFLDAQKAT